MASCTDDHVLAFYVPLSLPHTGQVSMAALAQRFSLPAELLQEAIVQRLGSVVFGQLRDGQLYTDTFVQVPCADSAAVCVCVSV